MTFHVFSLPRIIEPIRPTVPPLLRSVCRSAADCCRSMSSAADRVFIPSGFRGALEMNMSLGSYSGSWWSSCLCAARRGLHTSASRTTAPLRAPLGKGRSGDVKTTNEEGSTASRFWSHEVPAVPLSQLKSEYGAARMTDRRSRFRVRESIRNDGVISNFYPLRYPQDLGEALEKAPLYIYELRAFRTIQSSPSPLSSPLAPESWSSSSQDGDRGEENAFTSTTTTTNTRGRHRRRKNGEDGSPASPVVRRIHPTAVWDAVRRYFHHLYMDLPPMVRLDHKLYTTQPLRQEALQLPAAFHDLGWDSCTLQLLGRYSFCHLPPDEVQQVVNKIVPWCIRRGDTGRHAVVREAKGKFVSTELGLRANGVRVYQGVTVHALFLRTNGSTAPDTGAALVDEGTDDTKALTSRDLIEAEVNGNHPLRLTIHEFVRSFEYKGKQVESYKIEDASGVYLASYWEPPSPRALIEGVSYSVNKWKLKVFPERQNMRLFEFQKWSIFTEINDSLPSDKNGQSEEATGPGERVTTSVVRASNHSPPSSSETNRKPMDVTSSSQSSGSCSRTNGFHDALVLKLDAKGTVASELSLWEEVRQQFGPGPYDAATQERLRYAVEGTPIVSSTSMSQGILRSLCFDISENSEEGRFARQFLTLDARKLLNKVDAHQPYGLLQDGSLWPLQALHCCFDPRMKSWQDVTISALSLLPKKRAVLLSRFQNLLQEGLTLWGLTLSSEPWRTKALSVLPAPQKQTDRRYLYQKGLLHPFPSPHPTTVIVIGILGEDSTRSTSIRETTDRVAKYFKTSRMACVTRETEAVPYLVEQAMTRRDGIPETLRDKNTVAIIVNPEKETRAGRWLNCECLSRGILPFQVAAPKSPKLQGLLCGNIKRQLLSSFESDPLFGVQIYREVPSVAGKYMLFVGVDTCHTNSHSAGSVVGVFCTPQRNHLISHFWQQDVRGSEVGHVSDAFQRIFSHARGLYQRLDEVVVFQDGDVFKSMEDIKEEMRLIIPGCGFTFMCLHKRGNIRFVHGRGRGGMSTGMLELNNITKGAIIQDLTPLPLKGDGREDLGEDDLEKGTGTANISGGVQSFYLQSHDGNMSTSRIVHYTIHQTSPTLSVSQIQQLANTMSNVMAPQPTKLPMPTRCAHRLADKAERLLDAVPQLQCEMIPSPLCERLWFF